MSVQGVFIALSVICFLKASHAEISWSGELAYPLPSILEDRVYTTSSEGETVSLPCKTSCECRESDKITLSWQQNGQQLVADANTRILKDGTLEIQNVTSSLENIEFRCVASVGNWSVTSVGRRIRVFGDSKNPVSLQPSRQSLPPRNTLILSCNVELVPDSSIQWYKDGGLLTLKDSVKASTLPGGFLVVRNVDASDAGSYQCRVRMQVGKEFASNKVDFVVAPPLEVHTPPTFSYCPESVDVTEGQSVSIPCAATGSPTALVTISHDVQPVPNVVATGLQAAVYRIEKVGPGHAGKYVCYAKSGEAKITRNIWLKVFSRPKLSPAPSKRKLTPSRFPLSITCPVIGNPPPKITWYKDGKRLAATEQLRLDDSGSVLIKSVLQEDVGIYQCIAANKVGFVSHATFVFIDNALRPPINVKAVALSATSVNVTWQPNPLNNNNAVLAHIVFYEYFTSSLKRAKKERVVGEVSATHWKIDQLLGGRLYSIYLSTYGRNGQKSGNSQVARVRTLESVPGMSPRPLNAVNLGNKTIRVIWTPIPPEIANGRITQYKVEYGIAGFNRETIFVPAGKTQVDIMDLELGELYIIEVSAATSAGFGEAAKSTIKTGDPEIASEKGPQMELHPVNSSAVKITWTLRTSGYITGFRLVCVPIVVADYWHEVRIINLKSDERFYVMRNLNSEKDYRFELRIVSGPVMSKSSIIIHSVDKAPAIPGDLDSLRISNPRDPECAVKDNTSIFLSWVAPMRAADVDHYAVNIELGGRQIEKYKTYHTRNLRYLLKNLTRGTWYYIRVNAVAKQHRVDEVARKIKRKITLPSFQSEIVACKTAEARPGPPKNVFCNVSKNAHTAKVTWLPPEYPRGLITKYVIRYKHLARKIKTEWKTAVVVMEPNSKGYPLFHNLDADYYKKYRIEVYAVNSAGGGQSVVVESCALRKATTVPTEINVNQSESSNDLMSSDTKLGIIIGCSIASVFILTFVAVFIWKNPFRVKSAECAHEDQSKATKSGLHNDEFLYLQRLAALEHNSLYKEADCGSRCSAGSKNPNGRTPGENEAASQPLMPRYQTAIELTGGSSGQPVCTCTCLLHGRLRGQPLSSREQREFSSTPANNSGVGSRGDIKDRNSLQSSSSSNTTDDIDSAESADSRTQILRKSTEAPSYALKEHSAPNRNTLQQSERDNSLQV
ncbi:protogenin B-like [Rhopilema esculentum]|uniref:protogenin B-like n=1 Tax=Rhopilema esculentum TaxID=499914 RepID=UPI0031CF8CD6